MGESSRSGEFDSALANRSPEAVCFDHSSNHGLSGTNFSDEPLFRSEALFGFGGWKLDVGWSGPVQSFPAFVLETAVNAKTPRGKDAKGREMGRGRQA
jgi:hypothetical protein